MNKWLLTSILAFLLLITAFLFGYASPAPTIGVVENIKGIPFFTTNNTIIITEQLAHADLYINQPTLANTANITIDFDPQNITTLAVGIRENSFWLSYPKVVLYQQGVNPPGRQQQSISIPLTDKLQEGDRSLDLMFFATPQNAADIDPINAGPTDTTTWRLYNLNIALEKSTPTLPEFKDYAKSILNRERPL